MKSYTEFKKEYTEYLKSVNKSASEDEIKKKYDDYKTNSGETEKDEVKKASKTAKVVVKSPLSSKIYELQKRLTQLRLDKKSGKDVKSELKEVGKELIEQRRVKKALNTKKTE